MANPNIVNVTTIYGGTGAITVGTSYANVVQNPSSSGAVYKVNSLVITNACTAPISVTVQYNNANANTNYSANVGIPTNASLVVMGKDTPLYLLENQSIQVAATVGSYVTAIASWEQLS
jgi:hypothetical protein